MKKTIKKPAAKKPAAAKTKPNPHPWRGRQGDVLLTQIAEMPTAAVEQKRARGASIVLQQGTATGHAHQIKQRACSLHAVDDVRYLRAVEPVDLTHEEHDTVTIPVGVHLVTIHHQYKPGDLPQQVYD